MGLDQLSTKCGLAKECRAMIDHNRKSRLDCLSNEEMYFHPLSAIINYNSSQNQSINIYSMLEHTTMREDELLYSTKNILFLSLEKQVRIALDATLPESVVKELSNMSIEEPERRWRIIKPNCNSPLG